MDVVSNGAAVQMTAVSYAAEIRPLFSDDDVDCMRRLKLDLSLYEDVQKHSQAILAKLASGVMPPDGPWPTAHIKRFRDWIDQGMQP